MGRGKGALGRMRGCSVNVLPYRSGVQGGVVGESAERIFDVRKKSNKSNEETLFSVDL